MLGWGQVTAEGRPGPWTYHSWYLNHRVSAFASVATQCMYTAGRADMLTILHAARPTLAAVTEKVDQLIEIGSQARLKHVTRGQHSQGRQGPVRTGS